MIANTLFIAITLNLIGFVIAFSLKSDKFTDFMYGASFFAIAAFCYIYANKGTASTLLFILITLWALRIAFYLVIRILKIKRDKRFDGIRESFIRFGFFWLMQAVASWLIMIPSIFYFSQAESLSFFSILGLLIWLKGFYFEAVADIQKFRFTQNAKNKDNFINTGLWRLSRHPNYYGEILMWIGIYVYTLNGITLTQGIIGLISPLFITFLLLYVTGIPKLEKYADEKWGNDDDYRAYKRSVPVLIPTCKFGRNYKKA